MTENTVDFHFAINEDELRDDEMIGVMISLHPILLIKHSGNFYAYENRCAHLKTPLDSGELDNGQLICNLHQWRYDVITGAGINPKCVSLCPYEIKRELGRIYVGLKRES